MICSEIGDARPVTAWAGADQNSKMMMDSLHAGVLLVICVTVGLNRDKTRRERWDVKAGSGEFLSVSIYTLCRGAAKLHQVVIMFHNR